MAFGDFTQIGGTDFVAYDLSDIPPGGSGTNVLGLVDSTDGQGFTSDEENHLQSDVLAASQTNVRIKAWVKMLSHTGGSSARRTEMKFISHCQDDTLGADRYEGRIRLVEAGGGPLMSAQIVRVDSGQDAVLSTTLQLADTVLVPNAPDDWNYWSYETFVDSGQTHIRLQVASSVIATPQIILECIDGSGNQHGAGRVRVGGRINFTSGSDVNYRLLVDDLELDTLT